MTKIYELETKNGRVFRVAINNKSQENKLMKIIDENKNKTYEVFVSVTVANNGIHSIKDFESLTNTLL